MQLGEMFDKLGIEEFKNSFACDDGFIPIKNKTTPLILKDRFIMECSTLAGLDKNIVEKLLKIARIISTDRYLCNFFVYSNFILFGDNEDIGDTLTSFPDMKFSMQEDGSAFLALLALSGIPKCKKIFNNMNFPHDVRDEAFKDIAIWIEHFKNNLGIIGITPRILIWERNILLGKLYRLGRLQFGIKPFEGEIIVFRNKTNKQVIAIAKDGIALNSEGQFDGIDGEFDAQDSWFSKLISNDDEVYGNPVSPLGYIKNETVNLKLSQWQKVLAPGDLILDTHIPAGKNFNIEACIKSFDYAVEFFKKYFSDQAVKGWACHSWFLDNQYANLLPKNSNIIKFQRELYLYPINESGEDSYWRIFGEKAMTNDLKNLLKESSLQRVIAEFIEKGGRLRSGGGFFLIDDVPFGKQPYAEL
jgi:hypothetical protein